jgi:hypothetical protein
MMASTSTTSCSRPRPDFGVAIWRGNSINACELPLEMGIATIPSTMDLNDETTTTFRTVMNFPPETRSAGYRCASTNGGGKDGVRLRQSILASPTPRNRFDGRRRRPGHRMLRQHRARLARLSPDPLQLELPDHRRPHVALGLVGQIVPMKMTAYSNQVGRTFQGFAYMKLTQNSLSASGVALLGNSPNPFNPVTKIRFSVSKPGNYTLRLYNVQGALVRTVASGHYDVGVHEAAWDGRTTAGGKAASGVYYAKIAGSANEGSSGIKLVLAK